MRLLLAGLWARRGLNAAILLVTVTAVAASVLGPMYARAAAEHLLDSRIDQRAPYATGLTHSVPALEEQDLPVDDPDAYRPPAPERLLDSAAEPLATPAIDRYWAPARAWLFDGGGTLAFGGKTFTAPLYWRDGMCELARVTGRCPARAGEVLVQQTMADTLGVAAGDTVTLGYRDVYLHAVENTLSGKVQDARRRERTFDVVGTYRVTDPSSPQWFDLSRFTGFDDLVPPPAKGGGATPSTPALLVAPASMSSQTFVAGADRPIDRTRVDLDTMGGVERTVDRFRSTVLTDGGTDQLEELDVATMFAQVRSERSLLSQVTLAALAPLVVLALLLLFALVSAAAQVRRPYVALAKLRGHSTGQVLRFALAEPYLVVAVAVPVALAVAWGAALWIARTWLTPGIPVAPDPVAAGALAVVTLAALAASAAAALGVIREPLSSSLASAVRPARSSRWSLVLRSAVVAVAGASLAQLAGSADHSGGLLALLAPLFIALATAIAGVSLLTLLTRWWVRRTASRGGTAAYLASRRLARRQDLTRLMIPLLLAASVITFAASAAATSDDWRVSRAKAEVGASRVFSTDADPGRLLQVTREVDPEGRYVAAAVLQDTGDDMSRRLLVDTSRLGAVAAWDGSWSDRSLARLARRLRPPPTHPITFAGRRVGLDLRDVDLTSRLRDRPALWLKYADGTGEQRDVQLGNPANGPSQRLTATVEGCAQACTVQQVYLTGSASSVTDAQGTLTIAGVEVDGRPVDWRLGDAGAWRAARPFPVSLTDPPVVLEPAGAGLRLKVYLRELPAGEGGPPVMLSGFARITPSGTPEVVPVVVTDRTRTLAPQAPSSGIGLGYPAGTVVGTALSGDPVPMRVVGRTRALPGLGDEGAMSDLATSLVEFSPPTGVVLDVQLWAAAGTPASVLDGIRDAGVALSAEQRLDSTLRDLRSDAFSLGWRIFLIVGAATLLLAIFGVLASAVAQARWRAYEVAALRVVGLSRRTLVRASLLEHVAMLGLAVLLGVVSGYLALTLVLPSVDLGTALEHDPAPTYAVHWGIVAAVGASLFVLATLVALGVSRRVVRLGRPSTLRWAEQG